MNVFFSPIETTKSYKNLPHFRTNAREAFACLSSVRHSSSGRSPRAFAEIEVLCPSSSHWPISEKSMAPFDGESSILIIIHLSIIHNSANS